MKKKILIVSCSALILVICSVCVFLFGFYLPEKQREEERQRMVKEYYENKLSIYAEENESCADYEVDVAFLGDSLTDGYDLSKYYPQFNVSNRGIGGETTHGLEKRMAVSVYELKPKVAVMLIGGNNLETMFENYERLLAGFKENLPDTKVIICSLTSMGGDYAKRNPTAAYNNVIIESLANEYGFCFVDLYSLTFDIRTGEIFSDYTTDGVHLTDKAYRAVTNALTPHIEALLSEFENDLKN